MRLKYLPTAIVFLIASVHCKANTPTLYLNDIKWPPYFFPKLESAQQGLAKELLNSCISKMGYHISYKTLPIKRTHFYMKSGELDISVYSYLANRKDFVFYSKIPLFSSDYGLASKKGDKIEITEINDIKKYSFGHLAGLSHTEALNQVIEEMKQHNKVTIAHDLDAMFGQLLATPQRFQILASSKPTIAWRAKQLGLVNKIKIHPLVLKTKHYYLTVSKSTKNIDDIEGFILKFDDCLDKMKSSNEYKRIISKYSIE